jgi:hypothetical protein
MAALDEFDGQDHSKDIVIYRAIVRFAVEQSGLLFNPTYSEEKRAAVLNAPMGFRYSKPWPPPGLESNVSPHEFLAYSKLAAGMAVQTRTRNDITAAALRESVYSNIPGLNPSLHASDNEQYQSFGVCISLSEENVHSMTAFIHTDGLELPFKQKSPQSRWPPTELEMLVQADLIESPVLLHISTPPSHQL